MTTGHGHTHRRPLPTPHPSPYTTQHNVSLRPVCVCGYVAVTLAVSAGRLATFPDMTAVRPFEDYLVLLARERWRGSPKERDGERQGLDLFNVTSRSRQIEVVLATVDLRLQSDH